jgi:hypothetical protein
VYIAKQLGHQLGLANAQEMYGATLPDFPNLLFGYAHSTYLYTQTHYEFMKLVKLAPVGYQRAMAYGFASHNEEWGADVTAHKQALVSGTGGYVNQRVPGVASALYPSVASFLTGKVSDPTSAAYQLASLLADTCIESAVDLLVSEREFKGVGLEMMLASGLRGSFAPTLLVSAYASGLAAEAGITASEAAAVITSAEAKNREYLTTYGAVLTQPDRWNLSAGMLAQLAAQVLALYPYNLTVQPEDLVPLITEGLSQAKLSVQDDYSAELVATVMKVGAELLKHRIFTSLIP